MQDGSEQEVEAFLRRRFEGAIASVEIQDMEDLQLKNHLSGLKRTYLKVSFSTVQDLMDVRRELMPAIVRNRAAADSQDGFDAAMGEPAGGGSGRKARFQRKQLRSYNFTAAH